MSEAAYAAAARAKINLYLHVTGRRSDGYHLLDSLIVFTTCGDTVEAHDGDRLSLEVAGPFAAAVPNGEGNLVLRAARALAAAAGVKAGAHLRLIKRLPPASGIGGGSADAAATLFALMSLWGVRPADDDLARIALDLGADVPVCLGGAPAFVGGIGERLDPAPTLPEVSIVLANPGIAVATVEVFRSRGGPFSAPARFTSPPPDARALAGLLAERRNDLTDPAVRLAPPIRTLLDHLSRLQGALLARMSGSGATGFALFADAAEAEAAAATLRAAHPSWWVAQTVIAAPEPPTICPLPWPERRLRQ